MRASSFELEFLESYIRKLSLRKFQNYAPNGVATKSIPSSMNLVNPLRLPFESAQTKSIQPLD